MGQKECMWEAWVKKRVCLASSWLRDLKREGVKRKLREPEDRACLFLEGHRTRQASRRRSILGTLHPGVSLPVRLGS